MEMIEKIRLIKEIQPNYIVLVKIGSFYNVYEEDSLLLSYLFGYKLRIENEYKTCGFQITSANKVFSKLKEKEINYLIIDKRLDYEMVEEVNFKRKNQYKNCLKMAKPYVKLKEQLDIFCQNILQNIDGKNYKTELENLKTIENLLYKKV